MHVSAWYKFVVPLAAVAAGVVYFGGSDGGLMNPITAIFDTTKQLDFEPSDADSRVVAWIPYWDEKAAVDSMKKNKAAVDIAGLFWYVAQEDGSIATYEYAGSEKAIIDWAHNNGIEVMAVVTNLPDDEDSDWDDDLIDALIGDAEGRQRHIGALVALVEQHNYDGVQIDYESMRASQRDDFSTFIEELAAALHARGKTLGVAVMAKDRERSARYANGSQAQDWELLSEHADHLYVMAYGEHWNSSDAGPAAGLPWALSIATYARQLIPPEKLYFGMPLYGYDWGDSSSRARGLTHATAQDLIAKQKPDVNWDSEEASLQFTYEAADGEHEVWFEDGRSIGAKVAAVRELGISGFALWRLGGEDPAIWPHLR